MLTTVSYALIGPKSMPFARLTHFTGGSEEKHDYAQPPLTVRACEGVCFIDLFDEVGLRIQKSGSG